MYVLLYVHAYIQMYIPHSYMQVYVHFKSLYKNSALSPIKLLTSRYYAIYSITFAPHLGESKNILIKFW